MEGFTGINIESAHSQIEVFAEMGSSASLELTNAIDSFFDDLSTKWASPKAVEFSGMYRVSLCDLRDELNITLKHKIHGCNDAAASLANANGATWTNVDNPFENYAGGVFVGTPLKEEIDGVVGMAVDNVKVIRDIFKTQMEKVTGILSEIPKTIDFYSPDGSLVTTYATGIESINSKMSELISSTLTSINTAIDEESDNVLLAKQNASDTLAA